MIYPLTFGLIAIGYGLWQMLRPQQIAEDNQRFIESGEETYFEQRRSWQAYGTTPPTDAIEIVRRGRKEIALGVLGLVLAAIIYILDQGVS